MKVTIYLDVWPGATSPEHMSVWKDAQYLPMLLPGAARYRVTVDVPTPEVTADLEASEIVKEET